MSHRLKYRCTASIFSVFFFRFKTDVVYTQKTLHIFTVNSFVISLRISESFHRFSSYVSILNISSHLKELSWLNFYHFTFASFNDLEKFKLVLTLMIFFNLQLPIFNWWPVFQSYGWFLICNVLFLSFLQFFLVFLPFFWVFFFGFFLLYSCYWKRSLSA